MKQIRDLADIVQGSLVVYASKESRILGSYFVIARVSESSSTGIKLLPSAWDNRGMSEIRFQERVTVQISDLIGGMSMSLDEARHFAVVMLVAAG